MVFVTCAQSCVRAIAPRSLLFLIASGVATGLSCLFSFRAIQMGQVSLVVPIDKFSVVITIVLAFVLLKEPATTKSVIGGVLIAAGTFVMIF